MTGSYIHTTYQHHGLKDMSRKGYKKVTTVSKDILGRKTIETEWIPSGGGIGCGTLFVILIIWMMIARGCGSS